MQIGVRGWLSVVLTLATCAPGDKTSASAGAEGCAGESRSACEASTPTEVGNACYWVKTHSVSDACEVTPAGTECMELRLYDGGPGCGGYFMAGAEGALVLEDLDCFEPADNDWMLCFPDINDETKAATPACACAVDEGCAQYTDQAICEQQSTTRHPCAWQGGACDTP